MLCIWLLNLIDYQTPKITRITHFFILATLSGNYNKHVYQGSTVCIIICFLSSISRFKIGSNILMHAIVLFKKPRFHFPSNYWKIKEFITQIYWKVLYKKFC